MTNQTKSKPPETTAATAALALPALVHAGTKIATLIALLTRPGGAIPNDCRDPALIKLIVKGHAARCAVFGSPDDSLDDIAKTLGYDRDYFGVLLKISWLAPEITQSILEGRQQPGLNRQSIARMAGLPLRWDGQSSAKIH